MTHPGRLDRIPHEQVMLLIRTLAELPVQDITLDVFYSAANMHRRFKISYWDAAIIESARALQCEIVLSEELNDGQDYGGVRVVNPFRRRCQ